MERVKQWIEAHPYLSGALVIGVILLWYIRRNSASSAQSASVAYGVDPNQAAELQASYGIAQAQIAAQAQNDAYNAALTGQALQYGAAVQIAGLQTQAQLQSILSAADVSNNQTAASLALGLANIGQPYSFSGAIGGLNFQGGAAVAPTTVVNTTTQTQQQQTQAQQQQQVLQSTATPVTATVPTTTYLQGTDTGKVNPATLPGAISQPGYTPVPAYNPGGYNASFTPSNWLTSCPSGYELINGACLPQQQYDPGSILAAPNAGNCGPLAQYDPASGQCKPLVGLPGQPYGPNYSSPGIGGNAA